MFIINSYRYSNDPITENGFVTDGLLAFFHAGNYDGNGNYITNSPFPGTWTDISENSNDFTFSNFAGTTSDGAVGDNTSGTESYVKLDGTDSYIDDVTDVLLSGTDGLSLMVNIVLDNIVNWQRVFDWNNEDTLWLTTKTSKAVDRIASGHCGFRITDAQTGGTTLTCDLGALSTATSYNLCVTFDISTKTMIAYVDGSQVDTDSDAGFNISNWLANFTTWLVGKSYYGADPYLDGKINSWAIYDKALSSTEVTQNYNAGIIWTP